MEEYTEQEIELARSYSSGLYTEVQFNYLAHQIGSKRERMEELVERMSRSEPFVAMAKTILIMVVLHFLACTAYAIGASFWPPS